MSLHAPQACEGQGCPIHHPSDHHMKDWPLVLKMSGMMERTCPHGVGHPDPDSLAYYERTMPHGQGTWGIHGCDGCCG